MSESNKRSDREQVALAFGAAWKKANFAQAVPELPESVAKNETDLYLSYVEGLPSTFKHPPSEQSRKEKLEAFANALDTVMDQAMRMDDAALGYAIWSGLQSAGKAETWSPFEIQLEAFKVRTLARKDVSAFAFGVRKAIKALPPLDKGAYSEQLFVARGIEEYLSRCNIPFSTTDAGLAGISFAYALNLHAERNENTSYWLRKAVNHPDSHRNFKKRLHKK